MVIFIDNLRLYAHHGVLAQERLVGAEFLVSVRVDCAADERACVHDSLLGTISYADLCQAVRTEMSVPANLLEHVATRIARRIVDSYSSVREVWVRVVKCNPPMGADCEGAGVEISLKKGGNLA
ncbi:MAG: dihydroneopterin aldolase [Bacteroidaceae bacterium]|nr:dihydroneopterin aldolase [Bacteroidaceae bacterium]